jgi:hypothetical protein
MSETPKYEAQKNILADYCGIHRDSFDHYVNMAGFPTKGKLGWPVAKCRAFVFRHCKKEDVAAANDTEYAELKRLDLYERWRKTKLANDLKDGILVTKSFMDSQLSAQASAVTNHLVTRASRVAPDLAGRSIPEIEARLKESDKGIMRSLAAKAK